MSDKRVRNSILATLPVQDSSFAEVFLAVRSLGILYGTDKYGQRDSYLSSIQKALSNRIEQPILKWYEDPRTCFFKPYSNPLEGIQAAFMGFLNPICVVVCGLGLLGVWAANPLSLLTQLCSPAILELIAGIVSLGQALWYKIKGTHYKSAADDEEAAVHFLDAVTRFALVLPLAAVSLIAAPLDFVRFITRAIATLVDVIVSKDENAEKMDARLNGLALTN